MIDLLKVILIIPSLLPIGSYLFILFLDNPQILQHRSGQTREHAAKNYLKEFRYPIRGPYRDADYSLSSQVYLDGIPSKGGPLHSGLMSVSTKGKVCLPTTTQGTKPAFSTPRVTKQQSKFSSLQSMPKISIREDINCSFHYSLNYHMYLSLILDFLICAFHQLYLFLQYYLVLITDLYCKFIPHFFFF